MILDKVGLVFWKMHGNPLILAICYANLHKAVRLSHPRHFYAGD